MVSSTSFLGSRKPLAKISILLAVWPLLGCATIVKGNRSPIFIDSVPSGAEIAYQEKTYVTPCMIQVAKAYKPQKLSLWKDGYALGEVELRTQAGPMILGNIFFGGITGIIIDACTAAHCDFVKDNFRVQLNAVTAEEAVAINAAREEEKKRLEAIKKRRAEERAMVTSGTRPR
jgi:hypothetical protein